MPRADVDDAVSTFYKPPRRMRAGCTLQGQHVLALCAMRDELGDCVVRILGMFADEQDANSWIRTKGCRLVTDHDIHLAPGCEWVYPNAEHRNDDKYRNKELQNLVDGIQTHKQRIREYEELERDNQVDTKDDGAQDGDANGSVTAQTI